MDEREGALPPDLEAAVLADIPAAGLVSALTVVPGAAARVFAGFRPTPASLKLPPVRQRLRREIETNADLECEVWMLWHEANAALLSALAGIPDAEVPAALPALAAEWGAERVRLALLLDTREPLRALSIPAPEPAAPAPQPEPPPSSPGQPARSDDGQAAHLRAQVAELRAQIAHERKEATRLQSQMEAAARLAEKRKAEAAGSAHEAAERKRAADRSLRQVERLQKAKAELEARLHEATRAQARAGRELEAVRKQGETRAKEQADRRAALPAGEEWLQAIRDLIARGEAQPAIALLALLARTHPQAGLLREALADAYLAAGAVPAAVTELCWLARWDQKQDRTDEALARLVRAFAAAPGDTEPRRCLRDLAAALAPDAADAWEVLVARIEPLAREYPEACAAMKAVLAPAPLRASPGKQARRPRVDLDEPLEWPYEGGAFRASLRTVIEAIETNRVDLVVRVRRALALLQKQSPETRKAVLAALREQDDSYRSVLVRGTLPVVVDGSNVAWFGEEKGGRAHVAHLRSIRRELRGSGFFPIHVFVDASLVYQVDRPHCLEQMVARGEVVRADAGRDADEQILGEARALGAAVVTNDRMLEHDPEGVVRKLRFEIGPDGAVLRQW